MSLNVLTQGGGAGGEFASIFVAGLDESSTVAATKDGKTLQGKWNSAESRFEIDKIQEYGTWMVTATDGAKTRTQGVFVDAAVEYEIEIDLYKLWLYRRGDECEETTGGWNKTSFLGGGTLTKEVDNIKFGGVGDNHECFITFANTVDVTEYSKIRVTVSDLKIYRGRPTAGVWTDSIISSPASGGWARPTAYTNNALPSSDFKEVNISGLIGEHKFWVGIVGGGAYADSTTEFSLYEMWLE